MAKKNWRLPVVALLAATVALTATAEDGVTENAILIGQTASLSGQVAGSVKEMNEGAHAYIAAVNRQGGIHGRRIELRTLDDRFDPAQSAANAEQLVNRDRVFAMFLNRATPHTEAILPILAARGVPLVAPSTGAAIFHAPVNRLLFNVRAKYQTEVAKGVEHFATVGISNIGIAHVDDSFGQDALTGFRDAMSARQLTPALITPFDRAKPDIAATVDVVVRSGAGAVIIVGSAVTTAQLIKGIRARGSGMQVMTLSNNSSQAFVQNLGAERTGVIVSQITPAPHLLSSGLGQEFRQAARETGATVSYAAMEGFVAAKVLVEGLRRAGRSLSREGFLRALESIHRLDLGGLMVSYGPNDHTGSEYVELTMIMKDGRFLR